MRKILEDFYYGNISPWEQEAVPHAHVTTAAQQQAANIMGIVLSNAL